jgi:hypothetical protein
MNMWEVDAGLQLKSNMFRMFHVSGDLVHYTGTLLQKQQDAASADN